MLRPLFILTAPSVFLGLFIYDPLMLGYLFQDSLAASALTLSFYNDYVQNSWKFFTHSFMTVNFLILVFGLIFSYFITIKNHLNLKYHFLLKIPLSKSMALITCRLLLYLRFQEYHYQISMEKCRCINDR